MSHKHGQHLYIFWSISFAGNLQLCWPSMLCLSDGRGRIRWCGKLLSLLCCIYLSLVTSKCFRRTDTMISFFIFFQRRTSKIILLLFSLNLKGGEVEEKHKTEIGMLVQQSMTQLNCERLGLFLDQAFDEGKWNRNGKDRWSNSSERLNRLTFSFSFSFLSQNPDPNTA